MLVFTISFPHQCNNNDLGRVTGMNKLKTLDFKKQIQRPLSKIGVFDLEVKYSFISFQMLKNGFHQPVFDWVNKRLK